MCVVWNIASHMTNHGVETYKYITQIFMTCAVGITDNRGCHLLFWPALNENRTLSTGSHSNLLTGEDWCKSRASGPNPHCRSLCSTEHKLFFPFSSRVSPCTPVLIQCVFPSLVPHPHFSGFTS